MTTPKTIGFLGGMSWESTAHYYRLANELMRDRLGGLHSARCITYSVDFADIGALQVAGSWDEAGEVLAAAARTLEAAGADLVVLCTNTMHKVADAIVAEIDVPFLDLRDITAAAIEAAGLRRVGLLATAYTMEQPFWIDRIRARDIEVIVPETHDRADVHRIIFDELCRGVVDERSRQRYREVMRSLVERGCEGIVLGCTEIELLVDTPDATVPLFPTTRLHVEAAVDAALLHH